MLNTYTWHVLVHFAVEKNGGLLFGVYTIPGAYGNLTAAYDKAWYSPILRYYSDHYELLPLYKTVQHVHTYAVTA